MVLSQKSNMEIIDILKQKIKGLESITFLGDISLGIAVFAGFVFMFSLGIDYEQKRMRDAMEPQYQRSEEAIALWKKYQTAKQQYLEYFASKNGSVVYPVGCSRGNTIKEENKIFFANLEQALNQGYREATGC